MNTDIMSTLLPLVKQLGGGLKSKYICMQLLKHGRKKVAVMLSQHDVLKAAYKRAKNGPIRQRKRTNKRRTQKRKAARRRKLEDTVIPLKCWDPNQYSSGEEDWYSSDEKDWYSSDEYEPDWDDLREEQIWQREHNRTDEERWNDTFGRCRGCNCGQPHNNPYFCDDNWSQREHDSWENLRDKD